MATMGKVNPMRFIIFYACFVATTIPLNIVDIFHRSEIATIFMITKMF